MIRTGVAGWGINNANYRVQHYKPYWQCPFYNRWSMMLKRCLLPKYQKEAYKDASVSDDFKLFMDFRDWTVNQGVESEGTLSSVQLDKDLLVMGNKHYSMGTCCYVPKFINTLLLNPKITGERYLPTGVQFRRNYFEVTMRIDDKLKFLGTAKCVIKAYQLWQLAKADEIERKVGQYKEHTETNNYLYRQDVADALLNRAQILRDDAANGRETIKL